MWLSWKKVHWGLVDMNLLKQWAQFLLLEEKNAWDINLHRAAGHLRKSEQSAGTCGSSSPSPWHPPVLPNLLRPLASLLTTEDTLDFSSLMSFQWIWGRTSHAFSYKTTSEVEFKKEKNFFVEHPSRIFEPYVMSLFLCNNTRASNFHVVD